jgi:hypothetical protein
MLAASASPEGNKHKQKFEEENYDLEIISFHEMQHSSNAIFLFILLGSGACLRGFSNIGVVERTTGNIFNSCNLYTAPSKH